MAFWKRVRNLLVIALAAAALSVVSDDRAAAQNIISDLFGGIFGGGRPPPHMAPGFRRFGDGPRLRRMSPDDYDLPMAQPRGSKRAKPARSKKEFAEPRHHTPKAEATFVVTVVGDTLGQMLADGLDEAFAEKAEIGILHKAKENSGLVRADYYDWSKSAREIAAAPGKVDLAIMMIGSNDRQSINDSSGPQEPLTPRWRELYAARIDAIIDAFKEKKIPLVWVGLPVMKNERYSADMAQINEMFRERTAHAGVDFVDLWEAFADEHSQYQAFGPDLNGQIVRLRAGDGVHFTAAGARKLAHFVESQVTRRFDSRPSATPASPDAASPSGDTATLGTSPNPSGPIVFPSPAGPPPASAPTLPAERPAIGAPQSLTATGAEQELARRRSRALVSNDPGAKAARALADHVLTQGGDPPARANRADDFSLRGPPPAVSH
jgi:hypothetical protein